MPQPIDAVVAGHICLDVTPAFPAGGKSVAEILRPGTLVQVGSPTVSTGGPVSNTGLPLRRLGASVKLMGKCGDDMFGQAILDCIRREAPGAEAGMQVVPGEQTSYTVVLAPPGIDRIFLHCPGANDTFGAADINTETVSNARLVHFGYPPLMARTYADNGAELAAIFRTLKSAGATTSLDCAYPDPTGPAGTVDWGQILRRTLGDVDIFTPSVEELTFMLDRHRFDALNEAAGSEEMLTQIDGQLLRDLGRWCLHAGAGVVMIKCGYLGIYVATAGADRLGRFGRAKPGNVDAWAHAELFQPSFRVEAIKSANGAGDCAIAGFLAAFLNGLDLPDALRTACCVGGQNLAAVDTVSGVQSWEATQRQLAEHPPINEIDLDLPGLRWNADTRQFARAD